jgi:hypothetical protein
MSRPKKYNVSDQPIKSQAEKDEAWKRAEKKIAEQNLNDIHLKKLISGKMNSGVYWNGANPFVVEDGESIWEMMENDIPTDKILDTIYNNKGKAKLSKYLKNKQKNGVKN